MKKILSIVMVLVMIVAMVGCKKNAKDTVIPKKSESSSAEAADNKEIVDNIEPEVNVVYSTENGLDIVLKSIATTKSIEPLMYAENGIEITDEGYTFVDVVFEVTNKREDAINAQDIAILTAENADGGIYTEGYYYLECNNYASIGSHISVQSGETTRFHAAMAVDETEKKLALTLNFGGTAINYDYKLGDSIKVVSQIAKNEKIGEKLTFELADVVYADEVRPSNPGVESYLYCAVNNPDTETFAVINVNATNTTDAIINPYDFARIDVLVNGTGVDGGFWACETVDGSNIISDESAIVPANATIKAYYLVTVAENEKTQPLDVKIVFEGNEYIYSK